MPDNISLYSSIAMLLVFSRRWLGSCTTRRPQSHPEMDKNKLRTVLDRCSLIWWFHWYGNSDIHSVIQMDTSLALVESVVYADENDWRTRSDRYGRSIRIGAAACRSVVAKLTACVQCAAQLFRRCKHVRDLCCIQILKYCSECEPVRALFRR